MRGKERRHPVGEEEVAELGRRRCVEPASGTRGDLLQRTRDAVRVARVLDGARIGEVLALAAHRALDDAPEEVADDPDQEEAEPQHRHQRGTVVLPAGAPPRPQGAQHHAADHRDGHDAAEPSDQPHVQAHVLVEHVAELVRDDPLQLVAGQRPDAAPGHADHRVARRVPGGEGVDRLLLHDVDRRHRQPGGDRHLLDHVEDAPLLGVTGRRGDLPTAERGRDRRPSVAHLRHLHPAADQDDRRHPADGREHQPWIEEVAAAQDAGDEQVHRRHRRRHRQDEEQDEPPRVAPGGFLSLEEVHRYAPACGPLRAKSTAGTARDASSASKSAAGRNENICATIRSGKTERRVFRFITASL